MAYKIFISYSTRDLSTVNLIRSSLQNLPVEIFVAEYSALPGNNLSQTIEQAIKNSDLFILLWSKNSQESSWVPQEIGIAKASGKIILPIILTPNLPLPGFIQDLKYLDINQNPIQALQFLQIHVLALANTQQQQGIAWLVIVGIVLLLFLGNK